MRWGFPAQLRSGWRWFRSLNENPIYLREKGGWGNPNPFYEMLRRYSPFVVMAAIVLGLSGMAAAPQSIAARDALAEA